MSARRSGVPRPLKKAEFEIQFGTSQAEKGWKDLLASCGRPYATPCEHEHACIR